MANVIWTPTPGLIKSAVGTCTTGSDTFGFGATDGADLTGVAAFDVFIAADLGQTLSGAGTLEFYVYNPLAERWARHTKWDFANTAAGVRDAGWTGPGSIPEKGYPVHTSIGRVACRPNGITVSGGGLTIYIVCTESSACGQFVGARLV